MKGPRNLTTTFPSGKWCNQDGTLTPLALAIMTKLLQRTGDTPGTDTVWLGREADGAYLAAAMAGANAGAAQMAAAGAMELAVMLANTGALMAKAQAALDLAEQALIRANQAEAKALKALSSANDAATLSVTTRPQMRDGFTKAESATLFAMGAKWP